MLTNTFATCIANMSLSTHNTFPQSMYTITPSVFVGTEPSHQCKDNFSCWFQLTATCYRFQAEW